MERETNPMQSLCKSGCGFYGNPATDGLCSLCFKEALKKKQQPPVSAPSPSSVSTPARSSFMMETATALPTIPCLPASIIPASEHQPAEIMSQSHIPTGNSKDCDVPSSNNSEHNNNPASSAAPSTSSNEHAVVQEQEAVAAAPVHSDPPLVADDGANNPGSSLDQSENDNSDKDDKDGKKKKNRCATCRKKVGLTGFECRCGGLFCAVHRYSDKHDCSFNYREMGAQEIRRNNPVVVGEKIQKI